VVWTPHGGSPSLYLIKQIVIEFQIELRIV
jgi:hypothetical protein